MSKDIFKRLNGKSLTVEVDELSDKEGVKKTEGGILIPEDSSGIIQYRLATVIQVGHEIKDDYSPGDRIMLVPEPREKPIEYKGTKVQLIPVGVVIGVV